LFLVGFVSAVEGVYGAVI